MLNTYFQTIYSESTGLISRGWLEESKPNSFPAFVMERHSDLERTWSKNNKIILKIKVNEVWFW